MRNEHRKEACGRCRKPLPEVAPDRRLGFELKTYALCAACWDSLAVWLGSEVKIRRADAA